MSWLSLLSVALSNTHVRSFLLGLSGVAGTYLTQWLSGQDFGPTLTPLVAAGLPVLVNALQKWLTRQPVPATDAVDLGGLNQLAEDHDQPEMPAASPSAGGTPLVWLLVPLLWIGCQAAQASPPKAVLVGPTSARPGVPIRFDASQSVGEIEHYILKVRPQSDEAPTIQYDIKSKEEGKPPVFNKTRPYIWGVPGRFHDQRLRPMRNASTLAACYSVASRAASRGMFLLGSWQFARIDKAAASAQRFCLQPAQAPCVVGTNNTEYVDSPDFDFKLGKRSSLSRIARSCRLRR